MFHLPAVETDGPAAYAFTVNKCGFQGTGKIYKLPSLGQEHVPENIRIYRGKRVNNRDVLLVEYKIINAERPFEVNHFDKSFFLLFFDNVFAWQL